MSAPTKDALDLERDRQQRLRDLAENGTEPTLDEFRPGTFGCHELLDRTDCLVRLIDGWILSHPACLQRPEWFALADQALDLLAELYQQVGAEHLEENATFSAQPVPGRDCEGLGTG